MQSAVILIKRLLKKGYSKYQIKQFCKVQWPTVHKWSKGFAQPEPHNIKLLIKMLNADKLKVMQAIATHKILMKGD